MTSLIMLEMPQMLKVSCKLPEDYMPLSLTAARAESTGSMSP